MFACIRKFVLFGGLALLLCLLGRLSCSARTLHAEEDTVRRFRPRTVVLLADTSAEARQKRTELFYEQLKSRFYRNNFTKRLYDLVFTTPSRGPKRSTKSEEAMEYFQQFEGKVIQQVTIKKLPIFGPSVNDTTRRPSNWLLRTGNALHFQTRDWVIRKNILFSEGEVVDPDVLYDNERLLRSLSYIRDARIHIVPVPGSPDEVAIEIVTQDVFPLSFDAGRGPLSSYFLAVQNNNIFGIGHRLTSEALYRSDGTPALGYEGTYMVENVKGSFINASVTGAYSDFRRGVGFSLQRPFFTPDIRWAGGLDLQRVEQLNVVLHRDIVQDTLVWYASDVLDTWLGHSIPLNLGKPHPKGRESIVLAARASRIHNYEVPGGELAGSDFFINRKFVLGSVGWVRRDYRRDAYIYGFGRTEDVPLGALLNLTIGAEEELESRYYTQFNAAWGGYSDDVGYVDLRLAVGQYFNMGEEASRRVRSGGVSWISPLLASKRYKFRQLLSFDYLYGDRRLSYEFVTVNSRDVRGIRGIYLRGTQKLKASAETIAFSPIDILGFRLAGFVFADVAVLNDIPAFSLKGDVLQGYGLGLRVRNENLVFKTFQLRFSYYPSPGRGFAISLQGSPSSMFSQFLVGRPQMQPYR